MLVRFSILALIAALAGCAQLNLENRVACTAAKDKGFVVSQYGSVGLANTLAAADSAVICK